VTREGLTYSLYPLRRTDGKPRFKETGFEPHPNYVYSYNPCVPYNLTSRKGKCINVALCKYDEVPQPAYDDIGEQRDVKCDISNGKVALIYPIKTKPYAGQESTVNLVCNNDSKAQDEFILVHEDSLIFQLTSYCGCPNKCLPTYPTKPGPNPSTPSSSAEPTSTTPSQSGPFSSTTPSSEPETTSSRPGSPSSPGPSDLIWVLKIFLPSLLGVLVVVICFVCFWMRLSVIQRAHLCRCCHCYEQNRDPPREERNVFVTEKSPLICNHENDRAVEHECPGVKGKLREPVQEEDGDVKGENDFPGKD